MWDATPIDVIEHDDGSQSLVRRWKLPDCLKASPQPELYLQHRGTFAARGFVPRQKTSGCVVDE